MTRKDLAAQTSNGPLSATHRTRPPDHFLQEESNHLAIGSSGDVPGQDLSSRHHPIIRSPDHPIGSSVILCLLPLWGS